MLLRDATPVNFVAFPTKFAEYALTGLKVVMKASPPGCVEAAHRLGNFVALDAPAVAFTPAERTAVATTAVSSLGRIAATLARGEGLAAHARSAELRIED